MIGWPEVELGDHVDLMVGFPFKSARFLDDGGVRLLRGDNVGQGLLRWSGAKYWPEDDASQHTAYAVREDDVILAMDRPWIEAGLKYAAVRSADLPALLVQRVACMRGTSTLDVRFLRYIIGSREFTAHVKSITTGVNVPHISGRDIKRYRFLLPPLDTQRRIAGILGAYDDLIEVNRRRVAVLEAIARGLFEEWFVRFRFPGHEHRPLQDTPNGLLPEGCSVLRLDGLLVLQRGFDLPASARQSGPYPVISAGGLHGSHNEFKVRGPGVATGRSGTLGQVHLVCGDFWPLNTTLYVREFKRVGPAVAVLLLRHLDLGQSGTGSAVPTLNRNHIHGLPIGVPPESVVERLEDFCMTAFLEADALTKQNEKLAAARDLLLPRLISGQIDVGTAERQLETAA